MQLLAFGLAVLTAVASARNAIRQEPTPVALYTSTTIITTTLVVVQPPALYQTTDTKAVTSTITLTLTVKPTSTTEPVVTTTIVIIETPKPSQTTMTVPSTSTLTVTLTVHPPETSTVTSTITLAPPPPPQTKTVIVTHSSSKPTAYTVTKTQTVTTKAPVVTIVTSTLKPTAPGAVYKYESCSAQVTCPKGSHYLKDSNGYVKKCVLTYYNSVLTSSTCFVSNCCENDKDTVVVQNTQCALEKVKCPAGYQLAYDAYGASVPCYKQYTNNVLTHNTCVASKCCVRTVQIVTVTTLVPTVITTTVGPTYGPGPSTYVKCSQVIKCKQYKKQNGKIKMCTISGKKNRCTFNYCCVY